MEWIECTVPCDGSADDLCDRLAELGVGGMSVENEADFREFLENNKAYWDYVDDELEQRFAGVSRVKFWLSDDEEGKSVLRAVQEAGFSVETSRIADEDWENNWKQYYRPIDIGGRLVIVPEWEDVPEGSPRVPVRLNPGLIFGTGSHPSTRMCLEELQLRSPRRVLDLGCGSGILAIAALLLGAESALGCDIDEKAPSVARENAALNGISRERFEVFAADVLNDTRLRRRIAGEGFDLIFANIVADVVIALTADAAAWLAPGGVFICSGIIDGREDEVRAAVEAAGLNIISHRHTDNWHCFAACRDGEGVPG